MCPAAAEPGYSQPFVANSTGVSYYINTTVGSFSEAEENCQFNGGHVATYTSMAEQVRWLQAAACWPLLFSHAARGICWVPLLLALPPRQ